MRALPHAMQTTLREYWTHAESYQRFLYRVGVLLVLSAFFHAAVLLLGGGSVEGDVSWRKPILFGEAFGLTAISMAWVATFLPRWPVRGWLLLGTLGLANFGEVFLVAMQQWRGVPSHFNNNTPFDAAVFGLMGLLILLAALVIGVVTLLTFFVLRAPASLACAIRLGMALLVASQVFGLLMIRNASNTFGAAGAMKVPHALALHGLQVLPALAWFLLFASYKESQRLRIVVVASGGYAGLVAVSAWQAFRGLAPLDLDLATMLALGLAVVLFVGACVTTLAGLRAAKPQPRAEQEG